MSVYVGIGVHRKRSQVAVIDQAGQVLANRNVPNGEPTGADGRCSGYSSAWGNGNRLTALPTTRGFCDNRAPTRRSARVRMVNELAGESADLTLWGPGVRPDPLP